MEGNPANRNIQVAGGKERNIDSQSSGERNGRSPNRSAKRAGVWTAQATDEPSGTVLGKLAREGESPVGEGQVSAAGSGVGRDTRNPV